eukprot:1175738-Prorocentrum_minimum.AAC.8
MLLQAILCPVSGPHVYTETDSQGLFTSERLLNNTGHWNTRTAARALRTPSPAGPSTPAGSRRYPSRGPADPVPPLVPDNLQDPPPPARARGERRAEGRQLAAGVPRARQLAGLGVGVELRVGLPDHQHRVRRDGVQVRLGGGAHPERLEVPLLPAAAAQYTPRQEAHNMPRQEAARADIPGKKGTPVGVVTLPSTRPKLLGSWGDQPPAA